VAEEMTKAAPSLVSLPLEFSTPRKNCSIAAKQIFSQVVASALADALDAGKVAVRLAQQAHPAQLHLQVVCTFVCVCTRARARVRKFVRVCVCACVCVHARACSCHCQVVSVRGSASVLACVLRACVCAVGVCVIVQGCRFKAAVHPSVCLWSLVWDPCM
jgi:hypothetical protein